MMRGDSAFESPRINSFRQFLDILYQFTRPVLLPLVDDGADDASDNASYKSSDEDGLGMEVRFAIVHPVEYLPEEGGNPHDDEGDAEPEPAGVHTLHPDDALLGFEQPLVLQVLVVDTGGVVDIVSSADRKEEYRHDDKPEV